MYQAGKARQPDGAMKRCSLCEEIKPLERFARDGASLRSGCKDCRNQRTRHAYARDIDRSRQVARERYTANPEAKKQSVYRWRATHPERSAIAKRARRIVYEAIRRGTLIRGNECRECKAANVAIEAAHTDYTRPLDVIWLCRPCHRTWDVREPKTQEPGHPSSCTARPLEGSARGLPSNE
jgi:hypothetical protein